MAYIEEALPAARSGKKLRLSDWGENEFIVWNGRAFLDEGGDYIYFDSKYLERQDWEVIEEPTRIADYFVPVKVTTDYDRVLSLWNMKPYPIGQQPEGSFLIPGTERGGE